MPTENPDYNPEWESLHEFYNEYYAELEEEITRMTDTGQALCDPDAYQTLLEKQDECYQALHNIHRTRFRTIQDYATWLFETFLPTGGTLSQTTIPLINYEDFTSLEEVETAWADLRHQAKVEDARNIFRMPTGRPDGQDIFEQTGRNLLVSLPCRFHKLTHITLASGMTDIDTIVTMDRRDDEIHVCFTHDPESQGLSVINDVELAATEVYSRMIANEGNQIQKLLGTSSVGRAVSGFLTNTMNINSVLPARARFLDPGKIHFYTHILPSRGHSQEAFSRVEMDFNNGRFENAKWTKYYQSIPEFVQTAHERITAPQDAEHYDHSVRHLPLPGLDKDN